jgi:SAM-dependent methyltransferase
MVRKKKDEFIYNRVLKPSDYSAFGVDIRKGWEIHMALKTLRELGAARPGVNLLGVGAGREHTIYHLANAIDCNWVFATDLYASMGVWSDFDGIAFLQEPALQAPVGIRFDSQRIIPRHADMCALPFADNQFDGVFSSGSIEHVGQSGIADYDAISMAAREIARVTKPGGIISLSTEWKLSGEGWGWAHIRLFDADTIMRVIVEPSGCELVDEPDWSYDGNLADALDLGEAIRKPEKQIGAAALREQGYVFTSVHLALRKPL